jgi:hypothetical protein
MVNDFLKLDSHLRHLNLIYESKDFWKSPKLLDKPIYIKLSGSDENNFILTLYVRVHILSGSLLYMCIVHRVGAMTDSFM